MNLAASAPQWLAALLVALLAAAAVEDMIRLKISNWTQLAVLLAAIVAMVLAGPQLALWQNLLVLVAMLAIGTMLFSAELAGGGDIKLLAVTGLWFPLRGALWLLLAVLLAGGVLAILIIVLRLFGWSEGARRRFVILRRKGGIPYGVAIAAGAVLAIAAQRG